MAPLEGVDGEHLISTSHLHTPPTSMLSRLKRFCLCGAPAKHGAQATPDHAPRTRKTVASSPSTDATASTPDPVDNNIGLNSSTVLSSRGAAIGCDEDATFLCPNGQALEAKADQPPGLLTTLTLGGQPASLPSQWLSPTNMEVDTTAAAAVVSLYHYCHSSYAINAPTLASASTNGQASPQPETYIDLPKVSGSPPPLSPIPLGPPVSRSLRAPSSAGAGAAGAGSRTITGAVDAGGDELQLAMTSPRTTDPTARSGVMQTMDLRTQIAQAKAVGKATVITATSAAPSHLSTVLGTQSRPGSSMPLPELPGTLSASAPWPDPGRGVGWRISSHPSAPLPELQSPTEATPAQGQEDPALLIQDQPESQALLEPEDRPSRRQCAQESSGSFPNLASQPEMNAVGPGYNASATATTLEAASASAAAAAVAAAAAASPFIVAARTVGSRCTSSAQHTVSGMLSYGYGNGGFGYMDAPSLLADGKSAPYSGHISGTISPRLASFQYGPGANASVAASCAQPPPSPQRSSIGLVAPSRMSVSGAGSVLGLPIETSSLLDVTAPRTGLLPEQMALEMSMQAPALDLWAAAAHVSPTSRIAQGAYGVVYRGLWHGCTCAVKLMLAASTENLSSQLTEVFLCKALSCHPNIVQTFDCNVWRITADTLQAVQSLCGGGGGGGGGGATPTTFNSASPHPNPFGGFGGGLAETGVALVDGPLPQAAAFLHSAASVWFGASPSTLLSAAHSAAPSPSSHMGTYGLAMMGGALSPASIDGQPGVLLGQGSTNSTVPEGVTTAPSAAARQGMAYSTSEPWGSAQGAMTGVGQVYSLASQPSTVMAPPTTAMGSGEAEPSGVEARTVAVTSVPAAVALQQQERQQREAWQYVGGARATGDSDTTMQAELLSPSPDHLRSQAQPHVPAPLQLASTHSLEPLPSASRLAVDERGPISQAGQTSGSQDGRQVQQLPSSTRPLGTPVPEERTSASLACSGILPNLSPPMSLPASQPLTSASIAPSSNPSDLETLQSRLPQPSPRRSGMGRVRDGAAEEESSSNCEQPPTPPRHPRSLTALTEPPGQQQDGGVCHHQGQQEQQEQEQKEQPQQAEGDCQQLQSQGQDTKMPHVYSADAIHLPHGTNFGNGNQLDCRLACNNAVAAFGSSNSSAAAPSTTPVVLATATVNATNSAPSDHAAVNVGNLDVSPSSVRPGAHLRTMSGNGPDGPGSSGLGFDVVSAPTPSPAGVSFTATGGTIKHASNNPVLLPPFPASPFATNVDNSGPPAGVPARFPSSNPGLNFIDGRWPSPDASSRSPSPAPVRSSMLSFQPSGGGSTGATAIRMAAAAGNFGARVASHAAANIPVSAPQVSMSMGASYGLAMPMGMGLFSSPMSSGVLPASLHPGIASVTARRHSDRAITLTGRGTGVVGSLNGLGGPWSLQTRSAVATGDEGDATAAMVGARNLAQVLNLLGARDGQLVVVVVMEECDRGSLQQLLSKAMAAAAAGGAGSAVPNVYGPFSGGGRYPLQAALRALALTAKEVALGMAFLHHHNIIHGDLKPGNVLLKSSRQDQRGFVVKISDFGLSRVLHNSGCAHQDLLAMAASGGSSSADSCNPDASGHHDGEFMATALDGTVPYLAPELINNGQRSKASDVWAYGVLLWQLVTGLRPYDGLTQWQIMAAVSAGEELLTWPADVHPGLIYLGRACLAYNPRDRPSFAQVVRRLQALEGELRIIEGAK